MSVSAGSPMGHEACRGLRWVSDQALWSPISLRWISDTSPMGLQSGMSVSVGPSMVLQWVSDNNDLSVNSL